MCASEHPGLSCREAQLTTLADQLARRADAAESALAASRERPAPATLRALEQQP